MPDPHACLECLRRAWLVQMLAPYVERLTVEQERAPYPPELLGLDDQELAELVAPQAADRILPEVQALAEPALSEGLEAASCWALCLHDPRYPGQLRQLSGAPRALFGRGDPARLPALQLDATVAVVGARRATSYGRQVARELGEGLAGAGATLVSGLAYGIDACAHRGALDAGGLAVAVLPCGPDRAYPASNRSLWRRICEHGMVLSELPPGSLPWRWTFRAQSRITAGLASATVVVEAVECSGSLATANYAEMIGREVGAVPGEVTSRVSAGPNSLLAAGASVIRDAQDVVQILRH